MSASGRCLTALGSSDGVSPGHKLCLFGARRRENAVEAGRDQVRGNAEEKHTIRVRSRTGDWGATVSGVRLRDLAQVLVTLTDPATNNPICCVTLTMTTFKLAVDHRMSGWNDTSVRVQLGINNNTDDRAPLDDDNFGYFADMHSDLGFNYYLNLHLNF